MCCDDWRDFAHGGIVKSIGRMPLIGEPWCIMSDGKETEKSEPYDERESQP